MSIDALDDLAEIEDEARNSGYRVPEPCAIENAKRVLSWLKNHPRLMVYPFENGDVGVDAASVRANKPSVGGLCGGWFGHVFGACRKTVSPPVVRCR